ncbi:MAG: Aspartate--tRNA ligase [candidate division WS2 bacterium ADurb.Bin280]|uniref:Aspartate--tRNA ligase n=1 Tax=candidate division WS2 bacterium ADurb.Bin280 TaxID=1852829 RepID=A0A1V5SE70_9BACT|nr:MAG: Aspartate--tRNA ligase [candidate division WS2 bacterium ADurb.Bin280]
MFKYSNTDKKLVSSHHLFTSPNGEDIELLETEPEKARSCAYDLALNGFEIFGGSIRIHDRKLQKKIFDILQIPEQEAQRRFGHMLDAFEYGAPPHGGIASGIDRLIMVLAGENNIREVIPFPKTGDARDLMMGAPSQITEKQLKDVHIDLAKEAKGKTIQGVETSTVD